MTSGNLLGAIQAICNRPSFRRRLSDLLYRICEIDTSPAQPLDQLRDAESRVFDVLRAELERLELPGGSMAWREISPAIQTHAAFSRPYYAPGPVEEVYRGRGNLLYLLDREPAAGGRGVALNAHIDTVAPFFGPARSGDLITGRGVADDKGNVAVILGALQVLAELEQRGLVALRNRLTAMFVIDEETGGNGSLDLAVDRALRSRYDSILVLECTGNQLHPANRGAVFVRCSGSPAWSLRAGRSTARPNEEPPAKQSPAADHTETASSHTTLLAVTAGEVPGSGSVIPPTPRRVTGEASRIGDDSLRDPTPSLAEAYAFAILELLEEGDAIRQESDHPLFPHRPVQTCTGILGPFGVHPSAICGEVSFDLAGPGLPDEATLRDWMESGIRRYVARYGDKTQVVDPSTGRRKVERHYDLDWRDDGCGTVRVYGAGGHMGSLPQNDAAIAKWAYLVRELVEQRRSTGAAFRLGFPSLDPGAKLVFEGAQGFLPTHSMAEVKTRMQAAFLRGLERYLVEEGWPPHAIECDVTFDKLHNEAYACDPDSETMQRARRAAMEAGLMAPDDSLRGWAVSCDARLFATEHPGLPVLTFGAGALEHAHSDRERLLFADLFRTVCFVSLFVLRETGATT